MSSFVVLVYSSGRIMHLPSYPQGMGYIHITIHIQPLSGIQDGMKNSQRIRLEFPMQPTSKYIHIYSIQTPQRGPFRLSRLLVYTHLPKPPSRWENSLSLHLKCLGRKSQLEGGRNRVTLNYESDVRSRVVQCSVCGYTYSFTLQELYSYTCSPRR